MCGRYVHKEGKCFYCGNTDNFEEIEKSSIKENVIAEYNQLDTLLKDRRFDEVIALSYRIIDWMPNCAGIFWIRLLAKNKCISTLELISKGFSCEKDSDFYNALRYSHGQEQSAYLDIQNTMSIIKNNLEHEIVSHERECKLKTDVIRIKESIQGEINSRSKKLFDLWLELEKIERNLYELEMDCRLLVKEYQIELGEAAKIAYSIDAEVSNLEECSEKALQEFQVKLESALKQSEMARESIETTVKQHIWVKKFVDLVSQRDRQIQFIISELSALRKYENSIQQTLNDINNIEERHRIAMLEVNKYEFSNAVELLGIDLFNQILYKAGVNSIIPSCHFK